MTPLSKQYQVTIECFVHWTPFPLETLHTQKKEGDNKLFCQVDIENTTGTYCEISKADPSYTELLTEGLKNAYCSTLNVMFRWYSYVSIQKFSVNFSVDLKKIWDYLLALETHLHGGPRTANFHTFATDTAPANNTQPPAQHAAAAARAPALSNKLRQPSYQMAMN